LKTDSRNNSCFLNIVGGFPKLAIPSRFDCSLFRLRKEKHQTGLGMKVAKKGVGMPIAAESGGTVHTS